MKRLVLIASEEADVLSILCPQLAAAGLETLEAEDGPSALKLIRERRPAIAILGQMKPGLSGLDALRTIKSESQTAGIPVVLLTGPATDTDRIVALELGADDYLTKPFSARELVLRVAGILRRTSGYCPESGILKAGSIQLDPTRHEITVGGKLIDLTMIEFKLLWTLMASAGRVQTRDALLSTIWSTEHEVESRTVNTHIRRLRDKLGSASCQIHTIRKIGYRLDEK